MTIWSLDNHVRHPWFDKSVKKRKRVLVDREDSGSSDDSNVVERAPVKRRRQCNGLEQGLAHLSLQHTMSKKSRLGVDIGEQEPMIEDEVCAMDADDGVGGRALVGPVLLPSSVEEPEQDIPEVQMKTSSWYELGPDRIVITDLDSFEAEDDKDKDSETLSINSSLLEHIRNQWQSGAAHTLAPSLTSQALVLFQPLPAPSSNERASETRQTEKGDRLEDAMDIEPA
ncbi:hypothetical protein P691DRAFT_663496 [Macrolepiota fuliginosa MF-IS2]|uniref:Uncharacterized protein n=1 Tax=Macrolepiota fuliginosa MF-IS2 TaxID=1400762 RepID=A0A9P5XLA5_9AGAR|nr:hypothetical protein P691DRAFT_663496 [Macrolepiota fuliginosa MF-IS2]